MSAASRGIVAGLRRLCNETGLDAEARDEWTSRALETIISPQARRRTHAVPGGVPGPCGASLLGLRACTHRVRGVEFLDYDFGEMGWTENGLLAMGPYRAAWFEDSEGNILELSEVVQA